jgi:hypothetical protein
MAYCPECGSETGDGDRYCTDCGAALGRGDEEATLTSRQGEEDGSGPAQHGGRTDDGRHGASHGPVGATGGVDPSAGVGSLLRWSWGLLRDNPSVLGLFVAVELLGLLAATQQQTVTLTILDQTVETVSYTTLGSVLSFAGFVGLLVAYASAFRTTDNVVSGRGEPLGALLRTALLRTPVLFVLGICYAIAVTVGLVFLILPGLYLLVRLSLAFPAAVVDRRGVVGSLREGWRRSSGNVVRIGSVVAVPILANLVFNQVRLSASGSTLQAAVDPNPIVLVADLVLFTVVYSLVAVALAYVYVDEAGEPR